MGNGEAFGGVIGRYHFDSKPWWPPDAAARPGAPNVLVVVIDDVGFAQLGCYGSDLETPAFDGLAANGLRFTNFHTTSLCSPTRACVLTGRNHHNVGFGRITELATGFPGYNGRFPASTTFLSQVLRDAGWATYAVGKWHLTPEEEAHEAGSRAEWPLGRGFDRWYGFFGGETHQFAPALVNDNHQIEPPRPWQDGYHLTEDLVDQARQMILNLRAVDDAKPFFMYLCFGACHAPHQSPLEWRARFRGRFDEGWDAWRDATFGRQLGSTNDNRPWNFVPHTVEDALDRIDELGGPRTHNNYPWGWTVAGNTPFRRWKREVHEGGVADPLIVHWPRGISAGGELRRQYTHAVDLMPTLLELAGVEAPPDLDGRSFAPALNDGSAPEHRGTQYYEMFGSRAI